MRVPGLLPCVLLAEPLSPAGLPLRTSKIPNGWEEGPAQSPSTDERVKKIQCIHTTSVIRPNETLLLRKKAPGKGRMFLSRWDPKTLNGQKEWWLLGIGSGNGVGIEVGFDLCRLHDWVDCLYRAPVICTMFYHNRKIIYSAWALSSQIEVRMIEY